MDVRRKETWGNLDQKWDLLVVGGGITGAGIFRMAAQAGLKTLLVEAQDFAFGTSSRSSKLVHGGFRYLYNRQYDVTFESVREREKLLKAYKDLVAPLPFTLPNYNSYGFPSWMLHAGMITYDLMAPKWDHQRLSTGEILKSFPGLRSEGLIKGFRYKDAVLDDARLVLREIFDGVQMGGTALNYARAVKLLAATNGAVCGVLVSDQSGSGLPDAEIHARAVINATGPWSDELRAQVGGEARMRKQRGSHLLFTNERFPVHEAITLFHPTNKRAMFIIPWEGATIVGTTDIDHPHEWEQTYDEPFASQEEISYMLDALDFLFPSLAITQADILSTFSGLRPIITGGADDPSSESRAHQIWIEDGLITITGGKLTTYQRMAQETIEKAALTFNLSLNDSKQSRQVNQEDTNYPLALSAGDSLRLISRHGLIASSVLKNWRTGDAEPIGRSPYLLGELRWAARAEKILHLDDLLLRRLRLGMLLPRGGAEALPSMRSVIQEETGWDDTRWQAEEKRYHQIWQTYYSPSPGNGA